MSELVVKVVDPFSLSELMKENDHEDEGVLDVDHFDHLRRPAGEDCT